jgi:hypothetical protein
MKIQLSCHSDNRKGIAGRRNGTQHNKKEKKRRKGK